jgi:hypothetical protein
VNSRPRPALRLCSRNTPWTGPFLCFGPKIMFRIVQEMNTVVIRISLVIEVLGLIVQEPIFFSILYQTALNDHY